MSHRHGLTMIEVVALLVVAVVLAAGALPMASTQRCSSQEARSVSNLMTMARAHASYAADWNDRQFTLIRDDFSQFGGTCAGYAAANDGHPPLIFGDDCKGVTRGFFFPADGSGCAAFGYVTPFDFDTAFGSFRIPNARGFHEYVNGRFNDPTFTAPKDQVIRAFVEPLWGVDCEYAAPDTSNAYVLSSSYVLSAAAMFDPEVMANPADGGFTDPADLPDGYRSPSVSVTLYPNQKTRMLEHNWLQRRIAPPCNPDFDPGTWDGCEPYYFNAAIRSNPITLFYDGHVRGLSMMETKQCDGIMASQEGYGLWSRGTPLSSTGYFGSEAFDFQADNNSYHVLTTDGIRGRDTLR